MRYLTFALTKGRLAKKTMELLEQLGITCEEIKDKDSRKLIFVNEELKLKFFLSKGPDVPTYVEYGAADIGIVGKDTIMEEGSEFLERFSHKEEHKWPMFTSCCPAWIRFAENKYPEYLKNICLIIPYFSRI